MRREGMMPGSEVYPKVNSAWKQTCKVLLGAEIGELKDYEEWLTSDIVRAAERKSSLSGESVYLGNSEYCNGEFLGLESVDFRKRFEPLNINEIKDIDSIADSLQERFRYCGNIVLGNSTLVEGSAGVTDSHVIYCSNNIILSKYTGHSSNGNKCKYVFGSDFLGPTNYCIRGFETHVIARCFETWKVAYSSDIHFSFGIEDCTNCMFSFNLKNGSNMMGNLRLGKDEYVGLRAKLLEEIVDELGRKKKFPSLLDLARESLRDSPEGYRPPIPAVEEGNYEQDKGIIEDAFSRTSGVVLGKELAGVDDYAGYLKRHTAEIEDAESAVSGKKTKITHYVSLEKVPRERVSKYLESFEIGKAVSMDAKDLGSLASVVRNLYKIAYFNVEVFVGKNSNIIDCPITFNSSHGYGGAVLGTSKYSVFTMWPELSSHTFGCQLPHTSSFAINCYYSFKISRGFEVDCSRECADAYFLHNCEGMQEGMFCFNVKNLRRAIGNAEYPSDEYKKFKSAILEQVGDELEKEKSLKWDIYNIGCAGGK